MRRAIEYISIVFGFLAMAFVSTSALAVFPPGESQIAHKQTSLGGLPTGQRIAAWAESFVGVPYDIDPQGLYVTSRRIVADEAVDCMYHTFRSVELALTNSPRAARDSARKLRFSTEGKLGPDGLVLNYDERYAYAMDMVRGGRWGQNVTAALGDTLRIKGARGLEHLDILPASGIKGALPRLMSGDVVYFIKLPSKRVVGEIVGHLGILKREGNDVFLIHASGRKNKGGQVVKLKLMDYTDTMPFIGILVTRF